MADIEVYKYASIQVDTQVCTNFFFVDKSSETVFLFG